MTLFVVRVMFQCRVITFLPSIEINSTSKTLAVIRTGAGWVEEEPSFGELLNVSVSCVCIEELTSSGDGDW
jgi:hypothetical protein